ncbi:MAG: AMP-binding protein [Clostridia bacterium]|nr:AMP-binding protein [Clostridia bacterium]
MNRPKYKVREFNNFREMLLQSVTLYGHDPAFRYKNSIGQIRDVSYKRFYTHVNSLGTSLIELGLEGERIAIAGANSYKWCLSYMSVVCGAGVAVPTDKELPFEDIKSILEVSEAKAVIFDKKFGEKLLEHRDELPDGLVLIGMDVKQDEDGIISFDRLVEEGEALIADGHMEYLNKEISDNELTVLLFTSGTTGMSKAVMLSANNICSDIRSIMGIVKINHGERILSVLPLHHTYECTVTFLCCVYGGVTICFSEGLRYITRNLQEFKPHILIVVPLMLEKFYHRIQKAMEKEKAASFKVNVGHAIAKTVGAVGIDANGYFFAKIREAFGGEIRLIISGAAAIDPVIIRNLNKYGIKTFQGYGLTECSPIVICNGDKDSKHDSIGKAIPDVEARLDNRDENGVGEICVKGPMVMLGYYKNEEATKACFDDEGWFHTGDLARADKDGFYYICGRSKSVIVTRNGKNVYPEELEALLVKEQAVKECIVSGVEDEKGATIVYARIFPDSAAVSAMNSNRNVGEKEISKAVSDAVRSVNSKVVSYKMIKKFEIVNKEFQKTTTSKIKRNQ